MPRRNETNMTYCVNHEHHVRENSVPENQSTMLKISGPANEEKWYALTEVRSKKQTNKGVAFMPSSGIPVRVLTCSVCGYTELYHGQIIDNESWGQ
jgi:hypothetical protein